LELIKLDEKSLKYLKDMEWVQKDIWKLPAQYPIYNINDCEVFAKDIPQRKYSANERGIVEANLLSVKMIMQGPFWLGEDIVVGGFWDKRDPTRQTLGKLFPENSLKDKRVLEIGSMSGYDSFYLNLRNPDYYLSIEPSGYYYQELFLNSIYNTKIDFRQWFWQDIPTKLNNSFDVIINCGCLYHEYDFVSMIKRTSELLRMGGYMIVATVVVRNNQHKDCIKYMPDIYGGDMTYWFAIGETALMRLFESFGCEGSLLYEAGVPADNGKGITVEGYPLERYNFYKFVKTTQKNRPVITIPRY